MRKTKVFSGSSHPELSSLIVERLGLSPATFAMKTFSNRETAVEIGVSVRDDNVFIIQSGSDTVNDHLMELLILINACKTASARRITAILPYFPYSKQSKKKKMRGCISAKLVANMLAVAGVDHVITMDLHSSQIQGFFNRPVDNLFAEPSIAKFIREKIPDYENGVVVTKNAGGAKRVTSLADRLKLDFALLHRDSGLKKGGKTSEAPINTLISFRNNNPADSQSAANVPSLSTNTSVDSLGSLMSGIVSSQMNSLPNGDVDTLPPLDETPGDDDGDLANIDSGNQLTLVGDVTGRVAFIVDDMIDGTHSFLDAARHVKRHGAKQVFIIATHGILSGNALREVENCDAVDGLIVTNTYPIPHWKMVQTKKLHIIDISGVLAEAIRRTNNGESISYLFDTAV